MGIYTYTSISLFYSPDGLCLSSSLQTITTSHESHTHLRRTTLNTLSHRSYVHEFHLTILTSPILSTGQPPTLILKARTKKTVYLCTSHQCILFNHRCWTTLPRSAPRFCPSLKRKIPCVKRLDNRARIGHLGHR